MRMNHQAFILGGDDDILFVSSMLSSRKGDPQDSLVDDQAPDSPTTVSR